MPSDDTTGTSGAHAAGAHAARDDDDATTTRGSTTDGTATDDPVEAALREDPGPTAGAGGIRAVGTALTAEQRRALFADVPREPGARKPDAALVADGITRQFGGLKAVDVAHVEFQRGCITGLIGPNGAGKTTLFNLLTGFDQPNTGTWSLDGESLGRAAPHAVARKGVVRTFQLTKALSKMTVLDNVKLGATGQTGERILGALLPWTWRTQEREVTERARELLVRFKLDAKADDFAGSLSGGQRKLLEMARALMMNPRVVMLDEPMAGVNPALTQNLLAHVKSLRDEGMTVVFVEHDMDVIRDISDWVVVMAQGSVIAEGPPEELSSNQAVVDAYLGGHHDRALEFDADGNPVGETAEMVAEMEREIAAGVDPGADPASATTAARKDAS